MQLSGRLRVQLFGNFFLRLILVFLIFFLMLQVLNHQSISMMEHSFEASISDMCSYTSQNAATSLNRIFYEVYQTNFLIGVDQPIQDLFSSYRPLRGELGEFPSILSSIRTMNKVTQINDYVGNVYIYKRDSRKVISDTGFFTEDEFFSHFCNYERYPHEFWQGYDMGVKDFQILRPSTLQYTRTTNPVRVLPIVQSKIFDYKSKNLYIINLRLEKIELILDSFKPTPNSILFVVDETGQDYIAHLSLPDEVPAEDYLSQLPATGEDVAFPVLQDQKYMLLRHDSSFFFQSVKVMTLVPQSDITAMIDQRNMQRYGFTIFTVFSAIILILLFSWFAYAPLKAFISTITAEKPGVLGGNEFHILRNQFADMQQGLERQAKKLNRASRLVEAQVLAKHLSGFALTDEENAYCDNLFPQPDNAVQAAAVKFFFRKQVRLDKLNLYAVLDTVYAGAKVLEMGVNQYAVLRFSSEHARDDLYQQSQKLLQVFSEDQEQLGVHISVGTIAYGRQGIAQAYQTAQGVLSRISPFSSNCLLSAESITEDVDYDITPQMENKLTNLLLGAKQTEFVEQIKTLIVDSKEKRLPSAAFQRLLMELYFITAKALRQRGVILSGDMAQEYTEFCMRTDQCSQEEIEQFLYRFYSEIAEVEENKEISLSSTMFKSYIDEHFASNLSLHSLAQKYNTSPQYLSRLLKKELGVSFQTYLNNLRLEEAKRQLRETESSVSDIYLSIGYVSRNTFIRIFKAAEGVTPSEYRAAWKHSKPPS